MTKSILTQAIDIIILINGLIFSFVGLFKNGGVIISVIGGLLILASRVQISIILFKSEKPKIPQVIWEN